MNILVSLGTKKPCGRSDAILSSAEIYVFGHGDRASPSCLRLNKTGFFGLHSYAVAKNGYSRRYQRLKIMPEAQHIFDALHALDRYLFLFINGMHAPMYDQIMVFATWLGHPGLYPYYISIALVLAWKKPNYMPLRNAVVFTLSFIATSMILVPALKIYCQSPRPAAVFGEQAITVLIAPDTIYSFPSGHAAFAALLVASLMPSLPRIGKIALLCFGTLVCISRISVGAHFPVDVIFGVVISTSVVWLIRRCLPHGR